ncbi:MAG: saccharopine dehydrogenase NADP-binding domain-containing protein [Saprospiraceae bacterium]|nr:saccharopine dehydrogenase NADP-binding domain-containing protein [Saprospiraceae bacterium]
MAKTIQILGGYGGVGRSLAKMLLQHTDANLLISGRNLQQAKVIAGQLGAQFPGRAISALYADASDIASLRVAFAQTDLVVMATSTPQYIPQVAEAALACGADYLDMLVRQDSPDALHYLEESIRAKGRICIVQAGIHPGLPAVFIRYGARFFDQYHTANVALAMNERFENPSSTVELVADMVDFTSKIVKNGKWTDAGYRDMLTFEFGSPLGRRTCYPLLLRELLPLQETYQLKQMGMYVAGFNWVVDYFVFPFIILLQKIKKGFGLRLSQWLMYLGVNYFSPPEKGIAMVFQAEGIHDNKPMTCDIIARAADGYLFTALAVAACIKQYLAGNLTEPGIHLMGLVVEPEQLMEDLKALGLQMDEKISAGTPSFAA